MLSRVSVVALTAMLVLGFVPHTPAGGAYAGEKEAGVTEPLDHARGALGANFNQNLDAVDYRELDLADARWVRGFFPMPATDDGDPADHFAVKTILEAAERGYDTIFSLKFPYDDTPFPDVGSDEMAAEIARLDRVLPTVLGSVDIVTIGNEPFIESLPEERAEPLNEFYETVARHVIDVRREQCGADCDTSLYMGALNRLDLEENRTPGTERWMRFVRETPELQGVDIHPHVPSPDNVQPFLDYILPRMREDQTFLVTEFSLVWYWKQHLRDPVSAEFAEKYGFDADAEVWEVIRAAIDEPFSEAQWADFLQSSSWFTDQAGFLDDQLELYRGTGRLDVATYGFKQDELMVQDFGPDKTPWLLNSVFAPYTVEPREDGLSAPGYWIDDFRSLQQG